MESGDCISSFTRLRNSHHERVGIRNKRFVLARNIYIAMFVGNCFNPVLCNKTSIVTGTASKDDNIADLTKDCRRDVSKCVWFKYNVLYGVLDAQRLLIDLPEHVVFKSTICRHNLKII
ncbi:hypothetical protein FR483_n037L [Paramecium bursaria Chlorella virus FR483]|uniref:Uncharacterized protein n037L n=1 Tax=Paramecium bursaria Chlorella virus FR483 TaxID=399781 RepID=A7J691_PBCVF|nr:hypothetical protein FR483_n037L [Paramecium bursaria Chlorella virus FR483]ABT15322.1 hypothetical protein FR483_n037L [Paramecium bursaria Chlorella virus FR483]